MRHISTALLVLLNFASAQRIPIAVTEFGANGISLTEATALTDRLRNDLFRQDVFDVLDRGMMESILSEQDFQLSGCTSNECLIEIGQLLGARLMIGGSISSVGTIFTISSRMVDVETGKVLGVSDVDLEGGIELILKSGMRSVAEQLATIPFKTILMQESSLAEKANQEQSDDEPTIADQRPTLSQMATPSIESDINRGETAETGIQGEPDQEILSPIGDAILGNTEDDSVSMAIDDGNRTGRQGGYQPGNAAGETVQIQTKTLLKIVRRKYETSTFWFPSGGDGISLMLPSVTYHFKQDSLNGSKVINPYFRIYGLLMIAGGLEWTPQQVLTTNTPLSFNFAVSTFPLIWGELMDGEGLFWVNWGIGVEFEINPQTPIKIELGQMRFPTALAGERSNLFYIKAGYKSQNFKSTALGTIIMAAASVGIMMSQVR